MQTAKWELRDKKHENILLGSHVKYLDREIK